MHAVELIEVIACHNKTTQICERRRWLHTETRNNSKSTWNIYSDILHSAYTDMFRNTPRNFHAVWNDRSGWLARFCNGMARYAFGEVFFRLL